MPDPAAEFAKRKDRAKRFGLPVPTSKAEVREDRRWDSSCVVLMKSCVVLSWLPRVSLTVISQPSVKANPAA